MTVRHSNRRIIKITGRDTEYAYKVYCKRCGARRSERTFTNAQQCLDYYVEHAATDYHRNWQREKDDLAYQESPQAQLLRQIFGEQATERPSRIKKS